MAASLRPLAVIPSARITDFGKISVDGVSVAGCYSFLLHFEVGERSTAALHASASRDKTGKIHLSVCNLDPNRAHELTAHFEGAEISRCSGRVLTAEAMNAHNTFDHPEAVKPRPFTTAAIAGGRLHAELPPKSVTVLEIV